MQPAVKAQEWNRDKVYARTNALLAELADELSPVDFQQVKIQPENVEVPGVTAPGVIRRQLELVHAGEGIVIDSGVSGTAVKEAFQFMELMNADGGLNVAQIVFEAMRKNIVVPVAVIRVTIPGIVADTVQREHPHGIGEWLAVRNDHAPLAGGHVLSGVETEDHGI